MTSKRITPDFDSARNNMAAWRLHRTHGMALTSAFRAVNFAKQESRQINPFFLRKNLGLRPHP